ncbi:HXXEE domain-containing protein [Corynebacterium terpenotabidum]|uniref:HXXEE domain-containing protein n=1 Tax=Corynebacterium terpenotabidum Y-11 TaxID=1200352 RepID=S4XH07_9CORY|nr:HXXEE domain-containing protein [Corynebacterium terpenotabidum]AGP29933.1 hypothetical protein A606_01390 [Corynebacterium terpenotabidum Y-11]
MQAATWFFRHWYWSNALIAAIAAITLVQMWSDMEVIQRIMLGQFIVINLHFVEEFRLPGGFPIIGNVVEMRSGTPSSYPLNQWNSWAGNNWFAFIVYLPAVIWYDQTWLTLSITVFGLLEFTMRWFGMSLLAKTWFNPGMITAAIGCLPLSIIYLVHMYTDGPGIPGWTWIVAVLYPIAHYVVVFQLVLCKWLARRDTRFPFAPDEVDRGYRWIRNLDPAKLPTGVTNEPAYIRITGYTPIKENSLS